MNSPFPFTRTFLEKAVDHLRQTVLREDYEKLEELRAGIEKRYLEWAEKELRNCPMFMRRYTDRIAYLHSEPNGYGGTIQEKTVISCPGGVPLVPGHCERDLAMIPLRSLPGISDECAAWLRLKTKLKAVAVASESTYGRRNFYRDGLRYEKVSDGWALIGLPKYADDLDPLVKQYAEDVERDIEDLINCEPPIPAEEPADGPETAGEEPRAPEEPEAAATEDEPEEPVPEAAAEPDPAQPAEEKTAPAEEAVTETRKKCRKKADVDPSQLEFCF